MGQVTLESGGFLCVFDVLQHQDFVPGRQDPRDIFENGTRFYFRTEQGRRLQKVKHLQELMA